MKLKKKLRTFYVSAEKANLRIERFISLSAKKHCGTWIKIRKCILRNSLHRKYNIIVNDSCRIGKNIIFPHPQNIVIGAGVIIGSDCVVYHDVTIGQNKGAYPIIGNNVIIYPGAKIIGGLMVGNGAVVGANAVVTKDVPENAIVGGVPARVIRTKDKNDEFY